MDVVSRQMSERGITAYQAGKYQEAISIFKDLVQYGPDDWRSRLFIAMCLTRVKHYASARHELTFILDNCPIDDLRTKALKQLKHVILSEQSQRNANPSPDVTDMRAS